MREREERDCIAACERLCHDFGWHIDHRDYPAFLALFTGDGVFERSESVSRGQRELARFLEQRPAAMVTRHLFVGIRIDPHSADAATGTSTCLVFRTSAEAGQAYPLPSPPMRVVEFFDEFVKAEAGWRFKSRRVSHVFA